MTGATLPDKVWDAHVVSRSPGGSDLLYVDLHLVHEATSAQAFDGLRLSGRSVRRPELTLAVEDHNVPTDGLRIADPVARTQVAVLRDNAAAHGISLFRHGAAGQGIVHVVAPERGYVRPGMTVVCGDSHTSTHGAFGALAFGVGTSDVEHVLATQTIPLRRPATMAVTFTGAVPAGVTAKDMMLALLATIGANGANGHVIEYRGSPVRSLSMESRMTVCNLSVEAGARAGMVAPDETTFAYLQERPHRLEGPAFHDAVAYWRTLASDADAAFAREVVLDVSGLSPYVTWGTNPGQAVPLAGSVPDPDAYEDLGQRASAARALDYIGLAPGTPMRQVPVDVVFLGSCTNGRIEDLREAAAVLRDRRVSPSIRMIVVPGSMAVRRQAEDEGLDRVFLAAGAEWRYSGCSLCLAMNSDRLSPGQRCATTSNRNYEGRQGPLSRSHLVSPAVAAATALCGTLAGPGDIT